MEAAAGAPAALPSTPGSPALETSSAAAAQSSPPYPALAADLDDLFCAECLAIDDAWLAEVRKTRQGWVPTAVIAVHLARLFGRPGVTAADVLAASHGSDVLTASEDGAALRKKHPLRRISFPDTQSRTVVVERLPAGTTRAALKALFAAYRPVSFVRLVAGASQEDGDTLKRLAKICRRHADEGYPYAVVQFDTEDDAKAAYAGVTGAPLPAHLAGASVAYTEDHSRRRQKGGASTPAAGPNSARSASAGASGGGGGGGGGSGRGGRGGSGCGGPGGSSPFESLRDVCDGDRPPLPSSSAGSVSNGPSAPNTARSNYGGGGGVGEHYGTYSNPPLSSRSYTGGGFGAGGGYHSQQQQHTVLSAPPPPGYRVTGGGPLPGSRSARTPRGEGGDGDDDGGHSRWAALRGGGGGGGGGGNGGITGSQTARVPPLRAFAASYGAGGSSGSGSSSSSSGGAHGSSSGMSPAYDGGGRSHSFSGGGSGGGGGVYVSPRMSPQQPYAVSGNLSNRGGGGMINGMLGASPRGGGPGYPSHPQSQPQPIYLSPGAATAAGGSAGAPGYTAQPPLPAGPPPDCAPSSPPQHPHWAPSPHGSGGGSAGPSVQPPRAAGVPGLPLARAGLTASPGYHPHHQQQYQQHYHPQQQHYVHASYASLSPPLAGGAGGSGSPEMLAGYPHGTGGVPMLPLDDAAAAQQHQQMYVPAPPPGYSYVLVPTVAAVPHSGSPGAPGGGGGGGGAGVASLPVVYSSPPAHQHPHPHYQQQHYYDDGAVVGGSQTSPRSGDHMGGIASTGPHSSRRWARHGAPLGVPTLGDPTSGEAASSTPSRQPSLSSVDSSSGPLTSSGAGSGSTDFKVARGPDSAGGAGFGRLRTPRQPLDGDAPAAPAPSQLAPAMAVVVTSPAASSGGVLGSGGSGSSGGVLSPSLGGLMSSSPGSMLPLASTGTPRASPRGGTIGSGRPSASPIASPQLSGAASMTSPREAVRKASTGSVVRLPAAASAALVAASPVAAAADVMDGASSAASAAPDGDAGAVAAARVATNSAGSEITGITLESPLRTPQGGGTSEASPLYSLPTTSLGSRDSDGGMLLLPARRASLTRLADLSPTEAAAAAVLAAAAAAADAPGGAVGQAIGTNGADAAGK